MIQTITDTLMKMQNPDGGWGATSGKRSNLEATSLALLGLNLGEDMGQSPQYQHGLTWLTERQRIDGSWGWTDQFTEGSWATALAVLVFNHRASYHSLAQRGATWLLQQKGRKAGWLMAFLYRVAPKFFPIVLNPNLQGWPWVANTMSWVEPTAYALIVLKQLRSAMSGSSVDARIAEGEALLYDRMCLEGGWNYGNTNVFGAHVPPYPETTALALIALQDHPTTVSNQQSLRALQNMLQHEESGLILSWAILCFGLYGQDVEPWRERLRKRYIQTGFLGETKTMALALLALGNGALLFEVSPHA